MTYSAAAMIFRPQCKPPAHKMTISMASRAHSLPLTHGTTYIKAP
jgi:hypothetical protein